MFQNCNFININTFLNTLKTTKKLKFSFHYFPVKIFGKGFYSRFSDKFSTFQKKKKLDTWSWSKMPLFRYLSATMSIERDERERESLFYFCVFVAPTCERRRVVAVQRTPFFWDWVVVVSLWRRDFDVYVMCHVTIK